MPSLSALVRDRNRQRAFTIIEGGGRGAQARSITPYLDAFIFGGTLGNYHQLNSGFPDSLYTPAQGHPKSQRSLHPYCLNFLDIQEKWPLRFSYYYYYKLLDLLCSNI